MANTYAAIADSRRDESDNAEVRHVWTFDEDGDGDTITWRGGKGTVAVEEGGALGGGSVALRWSGDQGQSFAVVPGAFTVAAGAQQIELNAGELKPTLSGGAPGAVGFRLVIA